MSNESFDKIEEQYPYVVIRYMSTVYSKNKIYFEGQSPSHQGECVSLKFKKEQNDGRLSKDCRQAIIDHIMSLVKADRFRRCIVFAADDCVYCEINESKSSKIPPFGGIKYDFQKIITQ